MANGLRLLQYAPHSPPGLHGDHGLKEAGAVLGARDDLRPTIASNNFRQLHVQGGSGFRDSVAY